MHDQSSAKKEMRAWQLIYHNSWVQLRRTGWICCCRMTHSLYSAGFTTSPGDVSSNGCGIILGVVWRNALFRAHAYRIMVLSSLSPFLPVSHNCLNFHKQCMFVWLSPAWIEQIYLSHQSQRLHLGTADSFPLHWCEWTWAVLHGADTG